MFNTHVIFKKLGEGLGHDCYLDTAQSDRLSYYFETTAPHLGQTTAYA